MLGPSLRMKKKNESTPPPLSSNLYIVGFCPSGLLSQWAFVLVGFCPVGFCPSGLLSYTL